MPRALQLLDGVVFHETKLSSSRASNKGWYTKGRSDGFVWVAISRVLMDSREAVERPVALQMETCIRKYSKINSL